MSLTPQLRQDIDDISNYLFGGGYPDPVSNTEQLAFLFFFYLADGLDTQAQARARLMKKTVASIYGGDWKLRNPLNAVALGGGDTIPRERFRWSQWARALSGENLARFMRDEVFPFYAEVASKSATNFMDGARLVIDEPVVLTQIVGKVDNLRLDEHDADTKGDLFEYLLKRIKTAGELGQFRSPRHIIRVIVAMLDPKIGETCYDPAAGTAGFIAAILDHIKLANSTPDGIESVELDGKQIPRGNGNALSAAKWRVLQEQTFFGNDVDPKMVRLATMNLTLRGLPDVRIYQRNVLTTTLDAERKRELGLPEGYHVVAANPPFAGRVDKDRIVDDVKIGNSTATELLFIKYMMDCLLDDGRCGVIVPEGVLFGATGAHKELRRQLIENNRVEAVLSLPGGVFQPYAGVKTSVLFFRKGGSTDRVLFLHADNDGFKLDANHDTAIEADDLPGLVEAYRNRGTLYADWQARDPEAEWKSKWWFADAATIRTNDFNLSAGRYRPMNQIAIAHRDPRELLDELAAIEVEITEEVEALRVVLAEQIA
ncbi:MAG: restriction endonuclease subunit S [Gallionellales bacterium RIFCSPLOWO2_12_FULL_59_22]|nr:MAG: restriction endonuclease subunit S [Gallionellales bacterium RIFCSPLOWO2_02_FULL_59_110]OGT04148.1 MAG: restriction endonuclease subunit S [Gallionellales bacterium RIFCSPLOWO2_02_58_13]OGT10120.1 MAG: restriction endonuclease subunit S [Gallionellales bacterium RIFCSPLOWO2_12_FULL_59_22]